MMIMPPTPVAPEVLAGFSTFQQLDANTLARAACRTQVHRAPPHTCLLAQGTSDDWNLYLVDGKLQLVANDGDMELTESGSQKARAPVAFLKPRKYTVTTLTPVTFLWVNDAIIDLVRKEKTGNPGASGLQPPSFVKPKTP